MGDKKDSRKYIKIQQNIYSEWLNDREINNEISQLLDNYELTGDCYVMWNLGLI